MSEEKLIDPIAESGGLKLAIDKITMSIKATVGSLSSEFIFDCQTGKITVVGIAGEATTEKEVDFEALPDHIQKAFNIMLTEENA